MLYECDSIKKMLRLIEKLMITEVSFTRPFRRKDVDRRCCFHLLHTCRNCGSTVVDGNGKVIVVKNKRGKRLSALNNTITCLWLCA